MNERLIACIVPHGLGDEVAAAANAAGAGGGTLLTGQGTAPNAVLQLLGLGVSAKDAYVTVVDATRADRISAVVRAAASARGGRSAGILFTADVARFVRFGIPEPTPTPTEEPAMQNAVELVGIVVNKGYAEDAMAAARKAGATGGTVLPARGTARPGDESFFGVKLVPEKDMLVILAETERADAVVDAVKALPCFRERGSGVAFRVPVRDFAPLGG